jgi:murein DD-endopeptidase MepM/ murein hydrolase activator NlpD
VISARPFIRNAALLLAVTCLSVTARAASWSVKNEPVRLVNGSPVLLTVKPPVTLASLNGTLLGHTFSFAFDAKTKTWFTLAGISLEAAPGKYPLELAGETAPSKSSKAPKISFTRTLIVARASYPKIELSVEKKFTEPSAEELKEIDEAQKVKKDYLSRVTPDREWAGKFSAPADAAISDVFGTQRVFNGEVKSSHQGLDFRVSTGTPVAAMNDGTVLLARPLYFEGNFIVLDHGQGLLTLYMHLSEFKVKEGDLVKRGQIIGLSGGSGRATGPHLHVAVRWQGTYLDPATLLKLPLP